MILLLCFTSLIAFIVFLLYDRFSRKDFFATSFWLELNNVKDYVPVTASQSLTQQNIQPFSERNSTISFKTKAQSSVIKNLLQTAPISIVKKGISTFAKISKLKSQSNSSKMILSNNKDLVIEQEEKKYDEKAISPTIILHNGKQKKETTNRPILKSVFEVATPNNLISPEITKIEAKPSISSPSIFGSNIDSKVEAQRTMSLIDIQIQKPTDKIGLPVTFIMSALKPVPIIPFQSPPSRRNTLPVPQIELKAIPYTALIKGRLPIWAYEPIGVLQGLCEELRFAGTLLNKALNNENPSKRMCYVAAFIISGYSSLSTRKQKPFNPLRGESFDYISEDGWQYHAEQISHHPPVSAAFAQHKDWEWHNCTKGEARVTLSGCAELIYKLPITLTLHKYKEIYTWCKVKALVINPLKASSKRVIRQEGLMTIKCTNGVECRLEFLNNDENKVTGAVYENGKIAHQLIGQWDKGISKVFENNELETIFEAPPVSKEISDRYYGFNPFTLALNELHNNESTFLPPTDSRFRSDQRYLEKGEIEQATQAKLLIEKAQRKREATVQNYQPLWFEPVAPPQPISESNKRFEGLWRTNGYYWKSRSKKFKDNHSSRMIRDLFKI